jgi:hypothetical protein
MNRHYSDSANSWPPANEVWSLQFWFFIKLDCHHCIPYRTLLPTSFAVSLYYTLTRANHLAQHLRGRLVGNNLAFCDRHIAKSNGVLTPYPTLPYCEGGLVLVVETMAEHVA